MNFLYALKRALLDLEYAGPVDSPHIVNTFLIIYFDKTNF